MSDNNIKNCEKRIELTDREFTHQLRRGIGSAINRLPYHGSGPKNLPSAGTAT
ncbi:MAG: hypothetical protein JW780_06680 [Clostridiales bacterium]|nr:hypothetical protein [Clostridiales bacterium]